MPTPSGGRSRRVDLHERGVERLVTARGERRRQVGGLHERRHPEQHRQVRAPRRCVRNSGSSRASGSVDPKCALTLRARRALPGDTRKQPAVVEELALRLQRVEADLLDAAQVEAVELPASFIRTTRWPTANTMQRIPGGQQVVEHHAEPVLHRRVELADRRRLHDVEEAEQREGDRDAQRRQCPRRTARARNAATSSMTMLP